MTYSFKNDYSVVAHKLVLENLLLMINEQNSGYGYDKHTKNAISLIRKEINNQKADIHFLAGGTITNKTLISSCLKTFECVMCASTGHINVHETGAIEQTGHKCLITKSENGKILSSGIIENLNIHHDEHMVKPKMVYISNSTEIGSIYTIDEIKDIYKICKQNGLYLYIDGARLGSALMSSNCDYTMEELAKNCDAFYIGGTKNGGFMGEALVIINDEIKKDFRYHIKNMGALLAKGYICGSIFETLFTNNLFYDIAKSENHCATIIAKELEKLGYELCSKQQTNQVFVYVTKEQYEYIKREYDIEIWEEKNEKLIIRIVTSFDTTEDICYNFIKYIKNYNG